MGRLLALLAALIAGAALAWWSERTPEPRPASAPAHEFSAARAMADIEAMAARPHPLGSAENKRVRDHLLARMRALGLETHARRGSAIHHRDYRGDLLVEGGTVENVIGVLPGRDRSKPALALMAHYDSVPNSPGAADAAAGVAAALEIARALKARGQPERDVMLVITDGEESGLFGARAFFDRDPLAGRIGFIMNMEARGNGGRAQMFETGPGDGDSVALYRRVVDDPAAASLSVYVYERMPNDTDFSVPKEKGILGLNFAFIGRQFDYHSPTSTPANLEQGSVQHLGDQALDVAAAAAFAPELPRKTQNAVYSQTFGGLMIAYPTWAGWLVVAAAAALIAAGVVQARRARGLGWADAARGAGALLFAVLGAVAMLNLARAATGAEMGWHQQRWLLAQATRWEIAVMLVGVGFLLLAAATASRGRWLVAALPALAAATTYLLGIRDYVGLGIGVAASLIGVAAYWRPSGRAGAWAGVLLLGLVLAVALQALAPTIAYVAAWPLLVGAIAAAATGMATRSGPASLAALALAGALAVGFAGGYAHASFLSLDVMALQALPILMAGLVIWPLAQPAEGAPPARLLGPVLLLTAAAVVLVVRFDPPWTARRPELSHVAYHVDQDARRAFRVSLVPGDRPAWTDAVLKADGGAIAQVSHWMERRPFPAAPARFVEEAPPQISLARDADGSLVLRAVPPPGARILALQVRPTAPLSIVRLAEIPVKLDVKPGRWTRLWWEGEPAGVEIVLRGAAGGALEVRYSATRERWPAAARPLPPRPADVMPFHTSDSTVVTGTRRFSW